MIGFSVLAYIAHKNNSKIEMVTYISLAILFQPLLKISLGKGLWNIVDVTVAVGLIFMIVRALIRKNDKPSS